MKNYKQIISTLLAKIAALEEIVKQQAARIAELERLLNKNTPYMTKKSVMPAQAGNHF